MVCVQSLLINEIYLYMPYGWHKTATSWIPHLLSIISFYIKSKSVQAIDSIFPVYYATRYYFYILFHSFINIKRSSKASKRRVVTYSGREKSFYIFFELKCTDDGKKGWQNPVLIRFAFRETPLNVIKAAWVNALLYFIVVWGLTLSLSHHKSTNKTFSIFFIFFSLWSGLLKILCNLNNTSLLFFFFFFV